MKKVIPLLCLLTLFPLSSDAQGALTLEGCLALAREHSEAAGHARRLFRTAALDYESHRKSLLPRISFSGTLPLFNRSISKITLPDGAEAFVAQSLGNYLGAVALEQPIPFTGGTARLSAGLQRLDLYQKGGASTSYLANLANLGISQPLWGYNPHKWEKRAAPARYEAARRQCAQALEEAALRAASLYFDALEAQDALHAALEGMADGDTLLRIARERLAAGKAGEAEALEWEINSLQLALQAGEAEASLRQRRAELAAFLGTEAPEYGVLAEPTPPGPVVARDEALRLALDNGTLEAERRQRLLEAQSGLAQARADNGFSANLEASFGLSQSGFPLKEAFQKPMDQELFSLSLTIPLLDWGEARRKRRKAETALQDATAAADQQERELRTELSAAAETYHLKTGQLELSRKARELAGRRLALARERYLAGKTGFLEYSAARGEERLARAAHLQNLRSCWTAYCTLRKLTLFDFRKQQKIDPGEPFP